MNHLRLLLCPLIILLLLRNPTYTLGWFFSSSTSPNEDSPSTDFFVADFSLETVGSEKGRKLIDRAKERLVGTNSCWRNAYGNLFSGCSEIVNDREKQSRFAWHLSDCFQKDSGTSAFPYCGKDDAMVKCMKKLDENARNVYLEFYLETNSICHQLQSDVFKRETERLVNDLKKSAQFTEVKLETIEKRSDSILENSKQIDNSLSSIDSRIDQVAQTSKEVEEQIDVVLNYSKIILEQSQQIAASQSELQGGQVDMREKLEAGMTMLQDSYKNLGQDIEKLRNEAIEIEKEINAVSNRMSTKMQNIQDKADDIGNVAVLSLDKQKELLDGQSMAIEGLEFLTKFQSQALEESRSSLESLAEFGKKQQEELLRRQEQLQLAHDHLVENSRSILQSQEAFESKQANMFMALEKLFVLHNSILRESRLIKSFCYYFFAIIILYMLTSTKQTYCVRARLYLGLCGLFIVEIAIIRFCDDLDEQTWIVSKISMVRTSFLLVASIQILFSIFTYRDYEVLNHRMLQTLMEKVNTIENYKQKFLYEEEEEEEDNASDTSLSAWIDKDFSEDNDSEFIIKEEIAESSISTTSSSRKYNLRPRHRLNR